MPYLLRCWFPLPTNTQKLKRCNIKALHMCAATEFSRLYRTDHKDTLFIWDSIYSSSNMKAKREREENTSVYWGNTNTRSHTSGELQGSFSGSWQGLKSYSPWASEMQVRTKKAQGDLVIPSRTLHHTHQGLGRSQKGVRALTQGVVLSQANIL